jgi:hypothetical protein
MPEIDLTYDPNSIPWPDDTTSVFRATGAMTHLAWIPRTVDQWECYAEGYREAAERLYQSWCTDQHHDLAFPMVFLYRHYTELRLKELLQSGAELLDLPKDWKCSHRIDNLWQRLKPLLQQVWPEGSERDLLNAERLLLELAARDPISMEFRYPEDRDGKRHLADLEHLDIANFFSAMRQLSAFLDGASMGISAYLDDKRSLNFHE